jgi:hypothetical protein
VAKGFTQCKGIDYEETIAPVAWHATMHALLATAAAEDLEVEQIDIKTAYFNGPLKETIYMEPPAGALYGLKQAARAWNEELKRQLLTENKIISSADASLFYLESEGRRCFLLIYVDDGLLVGIKEDVATSSLLRWLHKLMETLYSAAITVQMFCDSVGALAQMHNPVGGASARQAH